ncbi:MAG: efflux RND transporter periplasmic adaptor subunit [Anaerolineae bacterium]
MKRVITIPLILAAIIGFSILGYVNLTPQEYDITADESIEIIEVERGTIVATVNTTGRIEALENATLNFEIAGIVREIYVERGDTVRAGQPLAQLDTTDLEIAHRLAQIDLTRAQWQLEQLQTEPSAADLASARAAVDSAEANLQRLLRGPSQDELTVAGVQLRQAEIALAQAQAAYDQIAYADAIGASPQAAQLQQATFEYEAALANFNITTKPADEADIKAAQAQVAQAKATLAQLQQGPSEADLAVARTAIDAAQVQLAQAELNLARATLYAPFDGTITLENLEVGLPPATPAITLSDLSGFQLKVDIDEIDIGLIALNQPALVTLDSLPGEEFAGVVSDIAPTPDPNAGGGIVAYEVTIRLDDQDPRLRPGQTANADIQVERLEDIVVAPNRAIQVDREQGLFFAEKLDDEDNIVRIEVELGQRNDQISQVLDGLEEGDRLVIRELSRRAALRQAIGGPGEGRR